MGLPNVNISRTNGNLGRVAPTIDNIFAFIIGGIATPSLALNQPVLITSIDDLKALDITGELEQITPSKAKITLTNSGAVDNIIDVLINDEVVLSHTVITGQNTPTLLAAAIATSLNGLPNITTTVSAGVINIDAPSNWNGKVLTLDITGTVAGTTEDFAGGTSAIKNELAYHTISRFYSLNAPGTALYLSLFDNSNTLSTVCDKNTGVAKTILDFGEGNIRGLFVAKTFAPGYVPTLQNGLDTDVIAGRAKLQALCVERGSENDPLFAIIPGYGFKIANTATLLDLSEGNTDQVAILIGADKSDGTPAIGTIAGWLAANDVHQNIARVASGSVLDEAWLIDGTPILDAKDKWSMLHDKRYILFRKIFQKSGYFFTDDPTACSPSTDYSSISWNRIINKAHVIAYGILVEHLNDDVETDSAGRIAVSLAANWEGDVENAIEKSMVNNKEISGVKCTIDLDSEIANDELTASLLIQRNGQAKTITVAIGYTKSID